MKADGTKPCKGPRAFGGPGYAVGRDQKPISKTKSLANGSISALSSHALFRVDERENSRSTANHSGQAVALPPWASKNVSGCVRDAESLLPVFLAVSEWASREYAACSRKVCSGATRGAPAKGGFVSLDGRPKSVEWQA